MDAAKYLCLVGSVVAGAQFCGSPDMDVGRGRCGMHVRLWGCRGGGAHGRLVDSEVLILTEFGATRARYDSTQSCPESAWCQCGWRRSRWAGWWSPGCSGRRVASSTAGLPVMLVHDVAPL